MKKNLLFFLLLALSPGAFCQVAGPQSGRSYGNADLPGYSQSWLNVTNVGSSDHQYATFGDLPDVAGSHTDYLVVTTFGFNIPAGSTITGIVAYVESSDLNASTADFQIRIVKGGAIGKTEQSTGALYLNDDTKDSYRVYGSPADLWGETWTPADISAADFGIAVAAQRAVTGRETQGRIDNIRLAVYYFNPTTLPLKLASFTAQPKDGNVRLNWSTSDESNMDRFELQRSADGTDFKGIGTLMCRNQATVTNYGYTDYSPLTGTSYYRLKILEKSGVVTYSKILTIQLQADNATTLYPSPWKKGEALFVRNPAGEKLLVQFYSNTGEIIGKAATSSTQVSLNGLALVAGIVRYKVFNGKNEQTGSGSLFVY